MVRKVPTRRNDPRLNWRETVKATINAMPPTVSSTKDAHMINVRVPMAVLEALAEAAKGRRLSLNAFLKRSAYAMAAHDLGISVAEFLNADEYVSRDTGAPVKDLSGVTFGPWGIDGVHEVRR